MMHLFKIRFQMVIFILSVLLIHPDACAEDTLISPDDPGINYYGRFDFSDPKAPRFNWSGSTIEFLVEDATTIGMELTDGAGYYDVEIDGMVQSTPVYADSWNSKKYGCINALSSGSHIIRIIRRNEPYWAIATLSGIYLSQGGKIMPLAKPERKMEFCGDSWTAGYFVEACTDQQANTNANKAWARITSKAFKAQDVILAESGIGLVKSLGGKSTLPQKYAGTFDTVGGNSTPLWDFTSWKPDIVTIFLGINDKSSGATNNEYIAAVHSFITTIRSNYEDVPILFMSYAGNMSEATKDAVAAETTTLGHEGIYYLEYETEVSGCSWHPTVAENKEIADSVISTIARITGWDTTLVTVAEAETGNAQHRPERISATSVDTRTIMIFTHQVPVGSSIFVIDPKGRIMKRLRIDVSGICRWNTPRTPEGVYYIGGPEVGWIRVLTSNY